MTTNTANTATSAETITETITGYLVDPERGISGEATVRHELRGYYDLLRCDLVDIVRRTIGGRTFDIICDDEGALKDDPRISAIDDYGRAMLVGALLVVRVDEEGNTVSLTAEELRHVARHVLKLGTRKHPEGMPMLTQVDY